MYGWLWIRHDHPRSKAFAKWVRTSGSSGVFERKRYGGRVTQRSLGHADAETMEAELTHAQIALLMLNIRSHKELYWD